jgi:superoxide dismutase, Cu-Zn family
MRKTIQLCLGCILAIVLMVGICGTNGAANPAFQNVLRARAIIMGAPGSGISGEATLTQKNSGNLPGVMVTLKIKGLAPGTVHGTHFHERGICEPPGFTTAMGHFDPGPASNSNPDANHPFHMGDMPNLVANASGVAKITHFTNRITLSPGPLSIFDDDGTVILVHGNPDMGVTGPAGSGVSGGPRVACGIVEMVR